MTPAERRSGPPRPRDEADSSLSVGVVIPAFNAEKWIEDALDSVALQTRLPQAVVVVNDGSVDETANVVQSWLTRASETLNLQLVSQENQGIAGARNTAIRRLETDLVALLDADDVWEPHHLARMCDALEENEDLVLCFANHQPFDDQGPVGDAFLSGKNLEGLPTEVRGGGLTVLRGGVFESLLQGNYVPPSTSVLRTGAIHDIGLFDPSFRIAEDYDFFLRLSKYGTWGYYSGIHAHYRLHDDNTSHEKNQLRMKRFGLAACTKLLRDAEELRLTDAEIKCLRDRTVGKGREFLYLASRNGLAEYGRCAGDCARAGVWSPVLNPRDWLRSVAFSLGYGRWRGSG